MKTTKLVVPFLLGTVLVLFATVSFGCFNAPPDRSSGEIITEERAVSGFSALEVGGAFKVILRQGDTEKLIIESDKEEISDIVTEVVGNKLKIHMKPGWRGQYHDMTIQLTFIKLESMDFSGAVEVVSEQTLNFNNLEVQVSGAAEISMAFNAEKFDAEFSGASELDLSGKCTSGYFDISGATDMNAENLEFTNLTMDVSGAADARINVTGVLNIDASGASTVRYKGTPQINSDVSGASSLKAM